MVGYDSHRLQWALNPSALNSNFSYTGALRTVLPAAVPLLFSTTRLSEYSINLCGAGGFDLVVGVESQPATFCF